VAGDRLSDWICLGVLASWVPNDAVEVTGKTARRQGGGQEAPAAGHGVYGHESLAETFWQVAEPVATPPTIKLANPESAHRCVRYRR
jgi:hypothetical protein